MTPTATAARSAKGGSTALPRAVRPQWAQPSYRRLACTQCGRAALIADNGSETLVFPAIQATLKIHETPGFMVMLALPGFAGSLGTPETPVFPAIQLILESLGFWQTLETLAFTENEEQS